MDELLFPAAAVAAGLWLHWYNSFRKILALRSDRKLRLLIGVTLPLCVLMLLPVLLRWSSPDVRSDRGAILFYLSLGALWLRLGLFLFAATGVSVREDVLERRNRAAAWAGCGVMAGVTLCFAGANIGKGPGPHAVLFCAALSTLAFFGLWICLERTLRLADQITIERDEGEGIRIGGWLAGSGLIFGTAVTGDWRSAVSTLRDFAHFAWGTIPLLLIAILVEKRLNARGAERTLRWRASLGIAGAYLFAAGGYVLWLNPH